MNMAYSARTAIGEEKSDACRYVDSADMLPLSNHHCLHLEPFTTGTPEVADFLPQSWGFIIGCLTK